MLEIFGVFFGGVLSFFSPCIFPLVPVYLSMVSGVNICEHQTKSNTHKVQLAGLLFVLGFSFAFTFIGASGSFIGKLLFKNKEVFSVIAGIIVIVFAVYLTGILKMDFLRFGTKPFSEKIKPGLLTAPIAGFVFALGWLPCVGPVLAGVLALSAVKETIYKGMILCFIYSLGLGIPFLIMSFFMCRAIGFFAKSRGFVKYYKYFASGLLIIIGLILIFRIKLPYFRI